MRHLILCVLAIGCSGAEPENRGMDPLAPDGTEPDCTTSTYPADPADPMALGEVLTPYSWPVAIHRGTGQQVGLDLGTAPCAADLDIDWSPHDLLVFIAIPAW